MNRNIIQSAKLHVKISNDAVYVITEKQLFCSEIYCFLQTSLILTEESALNQREKLWLSTLF